MANNSFDDLLQALQSALHTAQDTLGKRREEAIRRLYEVDESGTSRSPVFAFAVPRTVSGTDEEEMVRLPASSLRRHHRQRISMLSLEFECELKEKKLSGSMRAYTLSIKARKQGWWRRKKRQRMQIVFNGTDRPSGEVRLDGELLMEIPLYGGAGGLCTMTGTKQSIFRTMLNLLRNLWRSQTFVMTGDAAERAREIMEQFHPEKTENRDAGTSKKATFQG